MVTRTTTLLYGTDAPSACVLEILKCDLGINPSFGTIRSAIQLLAATIEEDVIIDRPHSAYDCTGKSFTSGIDLLNRRIVKAYNEKTYREEWLLLEMHEHHISVDV